MKNIVYGLFLSLAFVWQGQAQSSLFWEVESPEGKKSYLYGTYHLLGSDFLTERPKVMEAFEASNAVVVETVIDSSQMMQLAYLMIMNKSLKAMTDSADYQLLKRELEPLIGTDLAVYDQMKPIVLSTTYAGYLAEELTPDSLDYAGMPLDMHFAAEAKKASKKLIELETMQEQFEILFSSQTEEEQLQDLLDVLKEGAPSGDMMSGIITAYHANDLDALYQSAMEWEGGLSDMEVMIDQRNLNWVEKLEIQLQKGGLFIAVGALHLPGEKGLIQLLEARGFTLKPIK
ncbi:TraB/GumN family protein [Croceimicrobium sp.]|uniref:TraB/GumN family protein n=1 Tax=Croceimicrobium sp. TaxID=2828340 RepID=UPI003BA9D6A1